MSKIIDITDKLNFEEKPKIKIKGKTFEVNDSAMAMLKILPKLEENATPQNINELLEILFSEKDIEKIASLKLNFKNLTTVVMEAIQLVTGDIEQGETPTPATT